jgi:hypothetical protein
LRVFEQWRDLPKWKRLFFSNFDREARSPFPEARLFKKFLPW